MALLKGLEEKDQAVVLKKAADQGIVSENKTRKACPWQSYPFKNTRPHQEMDKKPTKNLKSGCCQQPSKLQKRN